MEQIEAGTRPDTRTCEGEATPELHDIPIEGAKEPPEDGDPNPPADGGG